MIEWFNRKPTPRKVVKTSASRLTAFRHEIEQVVAQYYLNGLTATQAIEKVAEITRTVDSRVEA